MSKFYKGTKVCVTALGLNDDGYGIKLHETGVVDNCDGFIVDVRMDRTGEYHEFYTHQLEEHNPLAERVEKLECELAELKEEINKLTAQLCTT